MTTLYPGGTQTFGDPCADLVPFRVMTDGKTLRDKRIILLATTTITFKSVFSNGLFQNVFVLYRMFEAMGYAPIFIVNDAPRSLVDIPPPLRKCRIIPTDQLLKQPIQNLLGMIEIGMSIDPLIRKFVKMTGGKIFKLYLGNILNIDVETPIFMPGHFFNHHVVGNSDTVWVSPHYGQHAEYAAHINHVIPPPDLHGMIAPYVWDPVFLTVEENELPQWRRPAPGEEVFVIMEPNISFQKCSLVPLLILNTWYRGLSAEKKSAWKGKVVIVNGDRLSFVPHFQENILPGLELAADDRLVFEERCTILEALKAWPTATFCLHNYNNEFNYMTLELLWCGFPVLHNSPSWSKFGYYYSADDYAAAVKTLEMVTALHHENQETYTGQARTIAWRYSPYNPVIQAEWRRLLE